MTDKDIRLTYGANGGDVLNIPMKSLLETVPEIAGKAEKADRRDVAGRKALLKRIGNEFREILGLCLTVPQASKFFGMPDAACRRILDALAGDGLIQNAGSYYVALRKDFIGTGFVTPSHRYSRWHRRAAAGHLSTFGTSPPWRLEQRGGLTAPFRSPYHG